jgi:peroxiredoxin Q/BCP
MIRTFLRRLFSGRGASLLAVGSRVPEFRVKDHRGEPVASSDLAGKRYVLWFYPKAATPG